MKKPFNAKFIQVALFLFLVFGFVANAAVLVYQTKESMRRVDNLEYGFKCLKVDQLCSSRIVDAVARKILSKEEYADIKGAVELERKELELLLYNNNGKRKVDRR